MVHSLPFSHKIATGPYPEPDESRPRPPIIFLQTFFNIIFLFMLTSFKDFLPSDFATKTFYAFPYSPRTCYMASTLCLMTQ